MTGCPTCLSADLQSYTAFSSIVLETIRQHLLTTQRIQKDLIMACANSLNEFGIHSLKREAHMVTYWMQQPINPLSCLVSAQRMLV